MSSLTRHQRAVEYEVERHLFNMCDRHIWYHGSLFGHPRTGYVTAYSRHQYESHELCVHVRVTLKYPRTRHEAGRLACDAYDLVNSLVDRMLVGCGYCEDLTLTGPRNKRGHVSFEVRATAKRPECFPSEVVAQSKEWYSD